MGAIIQRQDGSGGQVNELLHKTFSTETDSDVRAYLKKKVQEEGQV